MAETMVHRGPDGEGYEARGDCALGFRRLAIIDVEAASPPFPNEDHSVWSICNGQVYNAAELTDRLQAKGHTLRTGPTPRSSPISTRNTATTFRRQLNGMFAFAVWDEPRGRLLLARDRAGEKPLFYWHDGSGSSSLPTCGPSWSTRECRGRSIRSRCGAT